MRSSMDFYTKSEISSSISRVDELLESGIFNQENSRNILVRSALTETLILLRDLMAKSKKYAKEIDFADDIHIEDGVKNVSDAIRFIRDAICHVDSDKRNHAACNARLSFNTVFGKGCLASINGIEIKSDYEDDICYFFGSQHLYLKRHILRAFEEAKSNLAPFLN